MNMRIFLSFFGFLFLSHALFAQYTLSGRVLDAYTAKPIAGATIQLQSATKEGLAPQILATQDSDAQGYYQITSELAGRYQLSVRADAYRPLLLEGILLGSGPNTALDLVLEPQLSVALDYITVRASPRPLDPLASSVSLEAVRRLPATFYDPARLIALSPAVIQTNDQANHLSVRGNSPNRNLWRLQGLAIVNPNHTANAGTITDAPTLSGGGVNALSAQLLDNSTFYPAGLPVGYGQSLGGTFDMRLRPGNNQRAQHQLQAGFIGFDLATEGPIGQGPLAASYLLNARYSFTGLLADMGVDFGGEAIRFQDLSLHLHQPLKNNGSLSFFALEGASENLFAGPDSAALITEEKELFDIDFTSKLRILGATYQQSFGRNQLILGAAYSRKRSERVQAPTEVATDTLLGEFSNAFSQRTLGLERLTARASWQQALGSHSYLEGGVEWIREEMEQVDLYGGADLIVISPLVTTLSVPYVSWTQRKKAWQYTLGLRYAMAQQASVGNVLEPSLLITHIRQRQRYTLSVERLSQVLGLRLPGLDPAAASFIPPTSYRANLAWSHTLPASKSFGATAYFQHTPNDFTINGAYNFALPANSALALPLDAWVGDQQRSQSYGLELNLQKNIREQDWYYQLAAAFFQSRYRAIPTPSTWKKGRYSQEFTFRAIVGKEWMGRSKQAQQRHFGFNLALIAHGGERYAFIRENQSIQSGLLEDTYRYPMGFAAQNNLYFRPDLRIYRRKFRSKTTHTLALDIQNLSNQQNEAFIYFDNFTNSSRQRFQQGLIPILSYRLEWL